MNDAAPIQCVNCGTEQPFARIYCVECGSSLDAAKPLGQTWAGTFLIFILLFCGATFIGFGAIALGWGMFDDIFDLPSSVGSKTVGVIMLALATGCGWGIWRLARR